MSKRYEPADDILTNKLIFSEGLFDGKIVLITGAAWGGIGSAVATQVARLGAKGIAFFGRRLEPLKETAEKLATCSSTDIFYEQCDIRSGENVEKFVQKVLSRFGRIDVLINNAGGQFPIAAENLNEKGFTAVIRNNLIGTWNVTSAVAKLAFIPQANNSTSKECNGRIVNVIAQIQRGFPGMVHTGAARAGVDNITKTLAIEWAKYNIKINSVAPGVVLSTGTNRYPPEFLDRSIEATPLKRLASCEEIANLITFLASEKASSYVTGQTYYIDGGNNLWGDVFAIDAKL